MASAPGASSASNPSAKDRIEADPPPALYPAADDPADPATGRGPVDRRPTASSRGWLAAHGNRRDDAAFTAWLEKTLPGPPAAAQRNAEVARVVQIGQHRTKAGIAAATWLEAYGKKDLWKLYAHDQAEMLPAKEGDARKADVKAMLKMTKKVADALGLRYRQSAPYVLHPSLRPDHTVHQGQVCPCSYPSRHAAAGAAATHLPRWARAGAPGAVPVDRGRRSTGRGSTWPATCPATCAAAPSSAT